jgi:hypothetical protein
MNFEICYLYENSSFQDLLFIKKFIDNRLKEVKIVIITICNLPKNKKINKFKKITVSGLIHYFVLFVSCLPYVIKNIH